MKQIAHIRSILMLLGLAILSALLCSCGGLAGDGPRASKIRNGSTGYQFVEIKTEANIPRAGNSFSSSGAPPAHASRRYSERIAVRDTLEIMITDTSEQSPYYRPGGSYMYGPIEVPVSGIIKVPYVAGIKASGADLGDLSIQIADRVRAVSASADVNVRRINRLEKRANVLGSVRQPGAYPIDRTGFNVLDLLAQAGGTTQPLHLYKFALRRDNAEYLYDEAALRRLSFPIEDGDLIRVEANDGKFYFTSGAVNRTGRFPFPNPNPSLADALSAAGGLNESRSDPRGVFIYRKDKMGRGRVYGVDLKQPNASYLSRSFKLAGQDTIYVSEAPLTEWNRLIKGILPFGGAVRSAGAAAAGAPGM